MSEEELTYRQAIAAGIADAMREDDSVFMLGEDIGAAGGAFKTVDGVFGEFGPNRVLDTPISEQAIVGCAIGAALKGLRPIAEIMFADFAGVCFDGIANQLAKYRYMTDGQVKAPVTIRMANGAGGGFAAQHSQAAENWFLNVAGLKIVAPSTPADVYGLMLAAVRDDNPVLVYEHKALFGRKGAVTRGQAVELGRAEVVREGGDVTVVATQLMRHRAEEAAEALEADGISAEVVDLRSLAPIDWPTLQASVEKTNRLVCVQEAQASGSWGATVVARLLSERFDHFDAPPLIVGGDETPIPYAEVLEDAWLPGAERIAASVRELVAF